MQSAAPLRGLFGLITLLAGTPAWADAPLPAPTPAPLPAPVSPACISSPFGPRRAVGPHAALFHNGIDFPAPVGAYVHAVAEGTVVGIRRLGAEGLEVDVLTHGPTGDMLARYAHLGTVTPALAGGARAISAGTPLGRVGRTGVTYGTHVHFELRLGGQLVDPERFFAVQRC